MLNLPRLTMRGCDDEFVSDKYATALVFRKKTKPCSFAYENLPGPFSKTGSLPTHNPSCFHQRSYSTN